MRLLDHGGIAELLGVTRATVRQYVSAKRYPGFPAKKVCPTCEGTGGGWDDDEVLAWKATLPGRGGGQFRRDSSEAGRKGWANKSSDERAAIISKGRAARSG